MIITTTPTLEGHRVRGYLGIVTGEAIIGANVFKDILASVRDYRGRPFGVVRERPSRVPRGSPPRDGGGGPGPRRRPRSSGWTWTTRCWARHRTGCSWCPRAGPPSCWSDALPELPEAETIARGLNAVLPGRVIAGVTVLRDDVVKGPSHAFAAALAGPPVSRCGAEGQERGLHLRRRKPFGGQPGDDRPDPVRREFGAGAPHHPPRRTSSPRRRRSRDLRRRAALRPPHIHSAHGVAGLVPPARPRTAGALLHRKGVAEDALAVTRSDPLTSSRPEKGRRRRQHLCGRGAVVRAGPPRHSGERDRRRSRRPTPPRRPAGAPTRDPSRRHHPAQLPQRGRGCRQVRPRVARVWPRGRRLRPLPHAHRAHRLRRPLRIFLPTVPGCPAMMRNPIVLSLAALCGLQPAPVSPASAQESPVGAAPGEALPVAQHTLENGMTFLILPRRQSPTVSLVVPLPGRLGQRTPGQHRHRTRGGAHALQGQRRDRHAGPRGRVASHGRGGCGAGLPDRRACRARTRLRRGPAAAEPGDRHRVAGACARDPERVRPDPDGPRGQGTQRDHHARVDEVFRRTPGQSAGAVVPAGSGSDDEPRHARLLHRTGRRARGKAIAAGDQPGRHPGDLAARDGLSGPSVRRPRDRSHRGPRIPDAPTGAGVLSRLLRCAQRRRVHRRRCGSRPGHRVGRGVLQRRACRSPRGTGDGP